MLTLEVVTRAEQLASELATAVGTREQAGTSPAADLRQRAFSHFVRTYNQIRRMLAFLRFDEGDADAIAPSLWCGADAASHPRKLKAAFSRRAPLTRHDQGLSEHSVTPRLTHS